MSFDTPNAAQINRTEQCRQSRALHLLYGLLCHDAMLVIPYRVSVCGFNGLGGCRDEHPFSAACLAWPLR